MREKTDTNAIVEQGDVAKTHVEWRVESRMPLLCETLSDLSGFGIDFFALQEGRKFTTPDGRVVDSLTPLVNHLEKLGYTVQQQKYNPTDMAFTLTTAWKTDRFEPLEHKAHYFTKNHFKDKPSEPTKRVNTSQLSKEEASKIENDIKDTNFGEFWERCCSIDSLKDIKTGCNVHIVNLNLALGVNHRLKASEILNDIVEELLKKDPESHIFVLGDLNAFEDLEGPEQLRILKKGSLKEATEGLKLPNGQKMHSTFFAAPYDFGAKGKDLGNVYSEIKTLPTEERRELINNTFETKCNAIGGFLDRAFYAGKKIVSAQSYLVPAPRFSPGPSDYTSEVAVKKYIMDNIGNGFAFPSDHQPLMTFYYGAE